MNWTFIKPANLAIIFIVVLFVYWFAKKAGIIPANGE